MKNHPLCGWIFILWDGLYKNSNFAIVLVCGLSSSPLVKAMLPKSKHWGSCHEVTEGADYRKIVGKGDFKMRLFHIQHEFWAQ